MGLELAGGIGNGCGIGMIGFSIGVSFVGAGIGAGADGGVSLMPMRRTMIC